MIIARDRLMPALAMGLSLPTDFFSTFHETADNQLRLLHYPEADRQSFVKGEKGRIGAHTVRHFLYIVSIHTTH